MSTVILTPTHIASDHGLVHTYHPHCTRVDVNHRKLFVSPDKTFIIGTCGNYSPAVVDTSDVYNAMGEMLQELIDKHSLYGFSKLEAKTGALTFVKTFDHKAPTFLVTRRHRFVVAYSDTKDTLVASTMGPYNGSGSGGHIAMGLLCAGVPLKDIWKTINRLNPTTSVEHTIISLNSLKAWKG